MDAAFEKYKKIGIDNGSDKDEDSLQAPSFEAFAGDLGISVEDPVLLGLAWKMNCKQPLQFSRREWVDGAKAMGVNDMKKLKSHLKTIRNDMESKANFRDFYNFIYGFVKDANQRQLDNETAVEYWRMFLSGGKPYNWALLPEWTEFMTNVYKRPVVSDLWKQLLDFAKLNDLSEYDPESAWPTAIDDFVEYMEKKGK